ncbi:hypothetical protein Y900_016035 [Mycolicibacterium aromaticivorans JS19b1 = JCM 16368]|uniref:Glycosyl transferase n=1 Tax=Mycolicibacterium aromaticivorans JS19b1 = JCM 16368 TaxID=1440774 RepID=A0A064CL73_9MYCO|nr:DUF6492 family protein [Mycolicibacterium aromaticivorans]KDF00412.1 hypothetical protein Y900_016035 [Mycolicibacterium aromaticivorans JS19b1 = JCM 16368]
MTDPAENPLSYALVTPSFRLDVDRCALLVESVERWAAPYLQHYLVIDRRDVAMFKSFESSRTRILVVEDIIPSWLVRIPGIRRFWFSFRTRPVKNWILQQIVKLSIPNVVNDDILLYTDSDVFYVAPYDPRTYERDGKVPLFIETGQRGLIANNDHWHAVAAGLLGIPAEKEYDTNFIGNAICWRRENVLKMQERLHSVAHKQWERAIAPLSGFSEYILYGLYVTEVLGEASGHWEDGTVRTLNHWAPVPMTVPELQEFKAKLTPEYESVMISAKSRTPVADIRKVFFQ